MNKYSFPATDENNVRLAGKLFSMNPVACKAQAPKQTAHYQFWAGILATNCPHVGASLFCRNFVHLSIVYLSYTAKSSGKSLMSFRRLPSTITFSFAASSFMRLLMTVFCNSYRAK